MFFLACITVVESIREPKKSFLNSSTNSVDFFFPSGKYRTRPPKTPDRLAASLRASGDHVKCLSKDDNFLCGRK